MLTLNEVKNHLRVELDFLDDDALITTLISAGYEFASDYTNRVIIEVTKELRLDDFQEEIQLPYLPVIGITSIEYKDSDDVDQAFNDYYLDLRDLFATVKAKKGFSFPATNGDYENVVITYTVGYTTIPDKINQAILLIIGSMYTQRENQIIGVSIDTVPVSAEYLLNSYRVVSV